MSNAAKRSAGSGSHPAVVAYRKKMASIADGMMPTLEKLNARIDRALEKEEDELRTIDPRREPEEDERREIDESAIDIVTLDTPFPRGARR